MAGLPPGFTAAQQKPPAGGLPPGFTPTQPTSPPVKQTPADRKGDYGAAPLPGADKAPEPPKERYQLWPERLARAVLEGAVSGFTLPHDVMQGEQPTMQRVMDLTGLALPSSVARGTGKAVAQAVAPKVASKVSPRADTAEAFKRAGVQPTVPMVTANRGVNVTSRAIGTTFPGYPIIKATKAATEQAGAQTEGLAKGLSGVTEGATAGERIQKGLQDFTTQSDERVHELYNAPALKAMDPNVLSTMAKTRGVADKLDAAIENPEIRSFVTDPNLRDTFALVRSAGQQGVSFDDLQKLRTEIGKLQPSAESKVGINKRATKALYSSLTDDLKALAKEAGGDPAVRALNDADQYTRALNATRLPAIRPLINAPSGENVFGTIQRLARERSGADWRKLAQIKRSVGEQDWKDVAAVTIRGLGHTGDVEAPFNPEAFIKNYGDLSPRGKEVLFDKDLRSALDDLETVNNNLKRVGKQGILFGANRFTTLPAIGAAMIAAPGPTTGFLGFSYVTARALTSPRVVRWLTGVGKAAGNRKATAGFMTQIDKLAQGDQELADWMRRAAFLAANPRKEQPQGGIQ